jgi:hypothetical protein
LSPSSICSAGMRTGKTRKYEKVDENKLMFLFWILYLYAKEQQSIDAKNKLKKMKDFLR